jgi:FAD binding domain/Berberine and berberine like
MRGPRYGAVAVREGRMWKNHGVRAREERAAGLRAKPPAPKGVPSQQAIADLHLKLACQIVLPTDPTYHTARQGFSAPFQSFPQLIVYCQTFSDVRHCLEFAKQNDMQPAVRSGGHSTAGYSVNSDIVIDLSKMAYAVVDRTAMRATAGPGTTFGLFNALLNDYHLHTPGGACEDVAIAGYMQGGGYGFTSREFGMNCDNVIEATIMLADGRIVVADEKRHSDLFWAIRGGAGGNFGILLQTVYRLYDVWKVWGFGLIWKLEDAPVALLELQNNYTTSGASNKLGYMVIVTAQQGENVMLLRGTFNGSREDGMEALRSLRETKGASLQVDMVDTYQAVNQYLTDKPIPIPDVPYAVNEDKQSCYVSRKLSLADWKRLMEKFTESPCPWSWFVIEPYGGKINTIAKGATAFIHRDVRMNCFFGLFWRTPEEREPFERFLDDYMVLLNSFGDGRSYQNYPRRQQKDYAAAYWGAYYSSLVAIKNKYDPDNVFRYQQSIKPDGSPADGALLVPPTDQPITPEPY